MKHLLDTARIWYRFVMANYPFGLSPVGLTLKFLSTKSQTHTHAHAIGDLLVFQLNWKPKCSIKKLVLPLRDWCQPNVKLNYTRRKSTCFPLPTKRRHLVTGTYIRHHDFWAIFLKESVLLGAYQSLFAIICPFPLKASPITVVIAVNANIDVYAHK